MAVQQAEITAYVTWRTPWGYGYTSGPMGHNVFFRVWAKARQRRGTRAGSEEGERSADRKVNRIAEQADAGGRHETHYQG